MTDNYRLDWHGDQVKTAMAGARRVALRAAALHVQTSAAKRCPIGQYPKGSGRVGGNLRSSITYGVADDYAWVGTNVHYAPWVEMGTRFMSPRPYLRPVLEEEKSIIVSILNQALRIAAERGVT